MRSTCGGKPVTLGKVTDTGDGLIVTCQRRTCLRSALLDVEALVAKRGRETTVPSLGEKMRCTKCGGRKVAFTRSIPPKARR